MIKFNPRAMMETAIEVMRQSIAESRNDGKASPRVGAVLVDIGDEAPSRPRITTAYRGELREGDHAEFTLLERKCRDRALDTCVLFATLEPCAPKSRNPPKLGCAERIVLARIKQVWVGIEDPDPTVDRKGIEYLRKNGVTVHMFDRDLQEVIRAENVEFIRQALERAAAEEEEETREVVLSTLESPPAHSDVSDFSPQALEEYRRRARFDDAINSSGFMNRLLRQGLVQRKGSGFVPTGFGMLLFGREPRTAMPQAGLLATIHYADGTEELKDFDGPLVHVPEEAMAWLEDKLPNVIDRSAAKRQHRDNSLFELIREGIVNALVHRNYGEKRAKCQLVVSPHEILIKSPGKPVPPITLQQLQSLDAPMLSRNPVLHYVFAKMDLAEERGLGLKSMRQAAESAGLPLPRYSWEPPYLVLRLLPSAAAATAALHEQVLGQLSESEKAGLRWLSLRGRATSAEYAEAFDVDIRTARRHLKQFAELGLVKMVGSGPSTEYVVV